jgi:hypothetical protein
MAATWIMVRVTEQTRRSLEAVRDSLERGNCQRKRRLRRDTQGRVSLDQVIELLVTARDEHKERVRRSKQRRRSAELLPKNAES